MKILALESSARAASAAVCEDGRLIAQSYQNSGLTHSRTLLPLAEDLLKNAELGIKDIELVAVAHGPGSFTGIRIGVAAAKGLAWAREIPCCGVSTLEAMAWQCTFVEDAVICPVMDARRAQVYNALFEMRGGVPERLCADRAISLSDLGEAIKNSGKMHFLVGDGAFMCYNALTESGVNVRLAPENLRYQSAYGVAAAALRAKPVGADGLEPVYLRLSQAERERLSRETKT